MTTEISRDSNRHLIGNDEFLEWLRRNGITPSVCQKIVFNDDFTKMTVTNYRLNMDGKRYVRQGEAEPATMTTEQRVRVPFPMRFLHPAQRPITKD